MRKSKGTALVGVDVSKDTLSVAWKGLSGEEAFFEVPNDADGIAELLGRVTGGRIVQARVVLESTGPYGNALTMAITRHKKAQVMRLRPQDANSFAKTLKRGKTDRTDAHVLLTYAERMPFKALILPDERAEKVRALSRYLSKVVGRRAACITEFQSARVQGTAGVIEPFHREALEHLDEQIEKIERQILELLDQNEEKSVIRHWTAMKGVKSRTVAILFPEFMAWPSGLTPKQVTAMVGLDPRPKQSGARGNHGSWPISRQGNARVRRILWTSASCAVRFEPAIKAYYEALLERGKPKMVAIVAVMRKLLIALWKMYQTNTPFDGASFTVHANVVPT